MFDILAVKSRHLQSLRDQSLLTLLLSNPQVLIRLLRLEDRITVLITGTVANPSHIRKLGIVITTNFRNISVTRNITFEEAVRRFFSSFRLMPNRPCNSSLQMHAEKFTQAENIIELPSYLGISWSIDF